MVEIMLFIFAGIFLVPISVIFQVVSPVQVSKFTSATGSSTGSQSVCATSAANRSCSVRSKTECVYECQRSGSTACVGVNYRQSNRQCEIYNQCPTSYAVNITGCRYLQKELTAGLAVCPVCVGVSLSRYQYVSSSDCSYPFTYNGVVYYNCMPSQPGYCGFKACLRSNRQDALCYPPADYQAQTISTSLTVSTLSPVTVQSVFGWIIIQLRQPTTGTAYNWEQSWSYYKNGFGSSGSNFWLGLERLYRLTSASSYRLRLEVQLSTNGWWYSAEYSSFAVGSETSSQYRLSLSGYSGDAGDSMQYTGDISGNGCYGCYVHDGMKFTTYDNDNDGSSPSNCATLKGGGWWYNQCFYACPTCDDSHALWLSLGPYVINAARMMIKLNV